MIRGTFENGQNQLRMRVTIKSLSRNIGEKQSTLVDNHWIQTKFYRWTQVGKMYQHTKKISQIRYGSDLHSAFEVNVENAI